LLAGAALLLLVSLVVFFARGLLAATMYGSIISVLDQGSSRTDRIE
jgi:hypothetical protein